VAALGQIEAGDYDKARQALERAISIYPRYFDAWHLLAVTLEEEGYMDYALLSAQRAAEIATSQLSQAWDTLASMVLARSDWEQAIAIDRALDIVDPARHSIICYRMAIAYTGMGEIDGAERLLRESIAGRVDLLDRALEEMLLEPHHHWLIALKLELS
jgi:tetratricopeptide (TPR) repeat protein